jgi:hypothetical protein
MSVRKSARLGTRPPTTFNNLEPDLVVDRDDDFVEKDENASTYDGPSRTRKRVKTKARSATKNPKGKRGRLGALPYVPPECGRLVQVNSNFCLIALQRNATGYFA